MGLRRQKIYLDDLRRQELLRTIESWKLSATAANHAKILLNLDESQEAKYTQVQIAARQDACVETVVAVANRFEGGIEAALNREKRKSPLVLQNLKNKS